jgi:hypothetical protein
VKLLISMCEKDDKVAIPHPHLEITLKRAAKPYEKLSVMVWMALLKNYLICNR